MRIIIVSKKLLRNIIFFTALSIVIISGIILFSSMIGNGTFNEKVQIDDECLTAFLTTSGSYNEGNSIEVFDITKGAVIKRIGADKGIINEAKANLNGINGMYGKVNAFPDKGLIVKVNLENPISINNKWLNDYGIKQVGKFFVILPEKQKPFLLVLDAKERPYFYNFKGSTKKLLKYIN